MRRVQREGDIFALHLFQNGENAQKRSLWEADCSYVNSLVYFA